MEQKHIKVVRQGFLGVLQLDRPKALNALDHAMVIDLAHGLAELEGDSSIAHVAITSTSSRAFCAGGDMRRIRQLVIDRDIDTALSFFRDEFALNQAIADCPKPIVAFVDGICMGGGLGISVHARHHIVAPTATFAMPETAIGYFPDVGATYFLNALPGNTGRWIGLTGARLSGSEACAVGLGTHAAEVAHFPSILLDLAASTDTEAVLRERCRKASAPHILDPEIDKAFGDVSLTAVERSLLAAAAHNQRAKAAQEALAAHSPHAIELASRLVAHGLGKTLSECLASEFAALRAALAHPDFMEGVRAVLVDKDHSPRWAR